jgi:Domain of unknown function DUF29
MGDLYDEDIVLWSERQAALLRRVAAGEAVNDRVDWTNIIDEVEAVGRSERSALRSHIRVVLEHLMKLQASPSADPRNGWKTSIRRGRIDIDRSLKDSPSLRRAVPGMISDELVSARQLVVSALVDFGERPMVDVDSVSFTPAQVLGDWFPGEVP